MSRSIDYRVVEMQFRNREFEAGIKETIQSLADLNKQIELGETGFGKKFSMDGLDGISTNVQAISDRFSALGIIGMTVLQELSKAAINLSTTLFKAVTGFVFDPIFEGGKTRATNIDAALFQFRGLGMDIEATMKNVLYAVTDTAYGMDEAARVASQLGATGMRAGDDMATALRAVSGVAAMTNSSYTDMGNIFTTVAGNGRLMGNQLLQLSSRGLNVAATLADSMGISEQAVREMVTKGQISFEIFYKAMDEAFGEHATKANETYAGSLANVRANLAKMGEVVYLQHFENMKNVYNSLLVKVKEVQAAIMPFLGDYNKLTESVAASTVAWIDAWDSNTVVPIFQGIKNVVIALFAVLAPIRDAFRDIFPATTNAQLLSITAAFAKFTKGLLIGEESVKNIRDTFKGVFAVLDIAKMLIIALVDALFPAAGVLLSTSGGILSLTGGLGLFVTSVRDAIKESDIFGKVLSPVARVLLTIAQGIKRVVETIVEILGGMKRMETDVGPGITKAFSPLLVLTSGIETAFNSLAWVVQQLGNAFVLLKEKIGIKNIASIGAKIETLFLGMTERISAFFSTLSTGQGLDLFTATVFSALVMGLKTFVQSLTSFVRTGTGIITRIRIGLDQLKVTLAMYQAQLQANVLKSIAIAIAILAASLWLLSTIDPVRMAAAAIAIGVLFGELVVAMALFQKMTLGGGFGGIAKLAAMMIVLSVSVLLLAFAMRTLSRIDEEGLGRGLLAIGLLMAFLVKSAKSLSSNTGALMKGALGFIALAVAIVILTSAVKKLGDLDPEALTKGLIGVGVLMAQLALFMKVTDLSGMGVTKGVGILLMAGALIVLAHAVKMFSTMDTDALIKGLTAMGIVLAQIAIFVNVTGDAKKVITTAIGLAILGGAMLLFGLAIEKMGAMPMEQIGRGLLAMGGALTLVVAAVRLMPTGMVTKAVGLLIISAALVIFGTALKSMGEMSVEEIAKSLITLALALTIIIVAMAAMTTGLAGAAALLVISVALTVLAVALRTLGEMSVAAIVKSLISIAGVFLILGVASTLLGPSIPIMFALATVLVLFGVAALAAGVGLLLFSTALTALAVSGVAGGLAIVSIVRSIIELIPFFLEQVGHGIIAIAKVITEGAPVIAEMIKALLLSFIDIIISVTPNIVVALGVLIRAMVTALLQNVPLLVDTGLKLITGILRGLASNMAGLVRAGVDVVVEFLRGINSRMDVIIDTAFKTVIAFINGLANAIRNNQAAIRGACRNLIDSMVGAIRSFVPQFGPLGVQMIQGLIGGVRSMARALIDAARGVVNGAVAGAKRLLGIRSPSTVFIEMGKDSGKGLIGGLKAMGASVAKASVELGNTAMSSMKKALSKVSDVLDGECDLQPTITPVLDMAGVESGLKAAFADTQDIDVSATTKKANVISHLTAQPRQKSERKGVEGEDDQPKISITNHYNVRNDNDVRKISQDQRNLLDRYNLAKGVLA